ncbi:WD repeat-containing protein 55-like isoform X2 [Schistocerca gregaria]|uniref:WD repeat-containing protein 55-like isoform X2 n=1 Tax=Schistocerca gregaria TaxID=7010 RepID=UPI00211DE8B9|nr:WD repeat-containing protein 55-like isoform X2 [Schistocerca gregaria]
MVESDKLTSATLNAPQGIVADEPVFKACFHPNRDVVAYGTLGGKVCMYRYFLRRENLKLLELKLHTKSCRDMMFSENGSAIYSCSADKSIVGVDVETRKSVFDMKKAHKYSISALRLHENMLMTGDDNGVIKIWDVRKLGKVKQIAGNEDYISEFAIHQDYHTAVVASGDQTFSVIDLRKGVLADRSEYFDEDLLCAKIVHHGKNVVLGGQIGDLLMCPWGNWKDTVTYPMYSESLDCMVKLDESTVITGAEDGSYQVIRIAPTPRVVYVGVGSRYTMGITSLSLCRKGKYLALCTDVTVHIFNVSHFANEVDAEAASSD